MDWVIKSDRPVYLQLMEKIQMDIVSGVYKAGGVIPSVRDLAAQAGVNPNTMQKALSELEKIGLLHAKGTSGRFVTTDTALITHIREEIAKTNALSFLESVKNLGYSVDEAVELLKKVSGAWGCNDVGA